MNCSGGIPKCFGRIVLLALPVILCSCGDDAPFEKQTTSVFGRVLVDGQPPGSPVQVKAIAAEVDTQHPTMSTCGTDNDGNFTLSTYRKSDGLPAGEYKLTFVWGQFNAMSASYGGPDKLGGQYSNPETSEFSVTVVDGEVQDLGEINLKSAETPTPIADDRN